MLALILTAALGAQGGQDAASHPLQLDRTGMAWTLPFKEARKKADAEKRLLMIKPVAFGTSPDGGW